MPEVGIVIPAHASALGKALLAFLPDKAEELFARAPLRSMTGETITGAEDLRKHLDEVRRNGLAIERDEAVLGESVLASPVFDSWGSAVGAIGVVLGSASPVVVEDLKVGVQQTARSLSRELGAAAWPPPAQV
jgi:DNA-binding IclR family transcriptional regulator